MYLCGKLQTKSSKSVIHRIIHRFLVIGVCHVSMNVSSPFKTLTFLTMKVSSKSQSGVPLCSCGAV
jgi:hypothetical protein